MITALEAAGVILRGVLFRPVTPYSARSNIPWHELIPLHKPAMPTLLHSILYNTPSYLSDPGAKYRRQLAIKHFVKQQSMNIA
jgi:hypothetical protein